MLARSVGRLDWWNIKDEHTAYEWACQKALYAIEPWGESRADMRSAIHTAAVCSSMAKIDDFEGFVEQLRFYLKADEQQTAAGTTLSPEQAARMMRRG